MEKEKYLCETTSSFSVITNDVDCQIVTKELGIEPERYFQKGDRVFPEGDPHDDKRQYGLWSLSKTSTIEGATIVDHIKYFQDMFENKLVAIDKLKNHYGFECVYRILVKTENTAEGFDLDSKELSFINQISSRFTFSYVKVEELR